MSHSAQESQKRHLSKIRPHDLGQAGRDFPEEPMTVGLKSSAFGLDSQGPHRFVEGVCRELAELGRS
jgi:hypothetical protein